MTTPISTAKPLPAGYTLIQKIETEALDKPYINLIADLPADKLYERHGFVETSTVGQSGVGMQRY